MKADKYGVFAAFELCYKGLRSLNMNTNTYSPDRYKNKFAELAYAYCQRYDKRSEANLTDIEMKGLIELSKDKSIVVAKADKGKSVVLLRKSDYVTELEAMLADKTR